SSIPTAVDPGTYTVYFYSTSSTNYYSSSIFSVQVTIAPADYDDLATVSVTLTDGIRLIFALEFSDLALADKNAYLQFSLDDGTVLGTQKITEATVDSKGRYKFTCPLLADQMTENINAQMFYSDGVEGDVYSYSVKQYADTVIANEATFGAKTVNLVKAMLNYGGYAQKYTGKNTSNLANSDLSDMAVDDKTVSIGDDYKISRKGAVTGLKIKSFKLVIDDLTEIQIGCQVQNGYDISDFDFSCDKGEVTIYEGEQEGYYYISIKKITPDKLDDIYSVTVTGEDSEITVYCSAFTYFKTVLESSAYDEKIVNLIKAMYEYNQASTNYVNG
ncbi:MAG: hypothetical protein IJA12_03770, partial [Oscillospiraceae bacterium]|nr:hypothetical protein [Oscillospiraceae bacterium]